jgi:hypothetical protein
MKSLKNHTITLNIIYNIDNSNKRKQKKLDKHIKTTWKVRTIITLQKLWLNFQLHSWKTNQVDEPYVEVLSLGVMLHVKSSNLNIIRIQTQFCYKFFLQLGFKGCYSFIDLPTPMEFIFFFSSKNPKTHSNKSVCVAKP